MLMLSACGPGNPAATTSPAGAQPSPSVMGAETVTDKKMTLSFAFGTREGIYSGEIASGLPQGQGVFTTQNAEGKDWTYEGHWENGHFSGMGKSIWNSGWTEEGTYKNDYLNGEGREYAGNKLLYEGNFKDGERDGQGTLYDWYGTVIFGGTFENGFIVESAEQRKARLDPFKSECVTMAYKDFMEKSKQLAGAKVKLSGTIQKVYQEDKGDEEYYDVWIAIDNEKDAYGSVYYMLSKGEAGFKQGEHVTVWGTFRNLYTYTDTGDGKQYTEPCFDAFSIEAAAAPTPAPTPVKTPAPTPKKTAASSQKLVNGWICQQGDYTAVYEFKANGTYTGYFSDEMGDFSEEGTYKADSKTIYLDPEGETNETYDLSYKFSGSKLILTYGDGESFTFKVYEP